MLLLISKLSQAPYPCLPQHADSNCISMRSTSIHLFSFPMYLFVDLIDLVKELIWSMSSFCFVADDAYSDEQATDLSLSKVLIPLTSEELPCWYAKLYDILYTLDVTKVPLPFWGTHPLTYSIYTGAYTDAANDTTQLPTNTIRNAPIRGFVKSRINNLPLDILNGFLISLHVLMSISGNLIEHASQYLKNKRTVRYILKPKSSRNNMSLIDANLRNHRSKSSEGLFSVMKRKSTFDILFSMVVMLKDGGWNVSSSGVVFAVNRENASNALFDLATKLFEQNSN